MTLLSCLAILLLAVNAAAQAPAPSPQASPAAEAGKGLELEPAPGGYTYSPQGRRDPFVSWLRPVGPGQSDKPKRPGLAGMLINEVSLKGIVKDAKGYTAMLLGPDGKSYFAKSGESLYDGEIIGIDGNSVTFRQQITDPLMLPGQPKSRDVKKFLYPSEEARQ